MSTEIDILKDYRKEITDYLESSGLTKKDLDEYWTTTLYNPKLNSREGILKVSEWLKAIGKEIKDPFPLYEKIGGGAYSREVHVPSGYAIAGRIHKQDSMVYLLKGSLVVVTENETKTITAPAQFVSKKGMKKVAYILEDIVWIDIHGTDAETTEKAEEQLFCDTYEEYEYSEMITDMGLTQDEVKSIVENHSDLIPDNQAEYLIGDSEIHGKGIFAARDYIEGEEIGMARVDKSRTIMGRYTNHSFDNNCHCEIKSNKAFFVANKHIHSNEEITVDYRHARKAATELDRVESCQQ